MPVGSIADTQSAGPADRWRARATAGTPGYNAPAMSDALEKPPVSNTSFQAWLQQGEQLYSTALNEFHAMEAQIEDLHAKLVAKMDEVNRIAQMIGRPPVEGSRRGSVELVPAQIIDDVQPRSGTSNSNATIARALTGKFGR
jgi:hypothetical protein